MDKLMNYINKKVEQLIPQLYTYEQAQDYISHEYIRGQIDAYEHIKSNLIATNKTNTSTVQDTTTKPRLDYLVYCDGACRGNGSVKNIGGWGVYMQMYNSGTYVKDEQFNGCVHNTTNNKMELTAIIHALNTIKERGDYRVITIRSDSQLCINICNGVWKAKVNLDLWDTFNRIIRTFRPGSIKFEWVKGHSTDVGNIRADELCNMAMDGNIVK